jgi:hypothetical protein
MVETMRTDRMRCRTLDQLQVSEGSEIDREVLMRCGSLVDNEDFKNDIELLDSDDSFGIDRVREPSKLDYSR